MAKFATASVFLVTGKITISSHAETIPQKALPFAGGRLGTLTRAIAETCAVAEWDDTQLVPGVLEIMAVYTPRGRLRRIIAAVNSYSARLDVLPGVVGVQQDLAVWSD